MLGIFGSTQSGHPLADLKEAKRIAAAFVLLHVLLLASRTSKEPSALSGADDIPNGTACG